MAFNEKKNYLTLGSWDAWIQDTGPLVEKVPLLWFGLLGCVDSRHRPFGEKSSLIIVWALGMRGFKTQALW